MTHPNNILKILGNNVFGGKRGSGKEFHIDNRIETIDEYGGPGLMNVGGSHSSVKIIQGMEGSRRNDIPGPGDRIIANYIPELEDEDKKPFPAANGRGGSYKSSVVTGIWAVEDQEEIKEVLGEFDEAYNSFRKYKEHLTE